MISGDEKLQQELEKIFRDLDFPELYREYSWKGDTHEKGFPDLYCLEQEISTAAKHNAIMQHHLVEIGKWGRLRNTKAISCTEPLGLTLFVNDQPAPELLTKPEEATKKIEDLVKGFGPTYASKLLHFAVPQIFGALDTRLVRIFGNAAPEFHLLNLDAVKSGDRWLISPDQPGWPGEYGSWIRILNHLADRLNKTNKPCPHPQKYYDTGLREKGIWLPADVETALFSYASQQIDPVPGELENLIGYIFRNKKILAEATTRRAHLNENPSQDEVCMDPLATLGDAVLDTIVVFQLYEEGYRDKGKLTQNKIDQVKREKTQAFAKKLNLHEFVQWGKGERKQQHSMMSVKALDTVTEALIGAIFLDAQNSGENGLKIVQNFLEAKKFFEKNSE
jgi:hypothetical protein